MFLRGLLCVLASTRLNDQLSGTCEEMSVLQRRVLKGTGQIFWSSFPLKVKVLGRNYMGANGEGRGWWMKCQFSLDQGKNQQLKTLIRKCRQLWNMYLIRKRLLGVITEVKSECRMVQPLWKRVQQFLKTLSIVIRPSNSTPGSVPKRSDNSPVQSTQKPHTQSQQHYSQ